MADTDFDHAIPMSSDTAEQQAEDLGQAPTGDAQGKAGGVAQTLKDSAGKYGAQAADRARGFAAQGQERAGGALDQLARTLEDAASQVDEKLGGQYGQYARQAASTVQGLSDQVKNKDIDELIEDVRGLVRKSPAVAIGAAAAVGFVIARLVQSGLDDTKA